MERDAEWNKTYHQGILVDITERKFAEEKLRKSKEKFRRIVETAGEGFILMDEDPVLVNVNDANLRILGCTRQELIGKTPIELATEQFKQFILNRQETLLGQEYREFEGICVAKDGRHVPILIHGNTLRDEFEELKGSGVALGVNETFDYKENNRRGLANGQIIAIGTDGIWEAVNQKGEMFGKERFRGIIRKNAQAAAGDILNAVYSELNKFTRGQRSEDDITLVVIKINGVG